jgi:hypothetical protein
MKFFMLALVFLIAPHFVQAQYQPAPTALPGAVVTLNFTVNGAVGQIVDMEIHQPDGGRLVTGTCCYQITLTKAGPQNVTFAFTAPTQVGTYTVALGQFGPNWTPLVLWQNIAGAFSVSSPVLPSNWACTFSATGAQIVCNGAPST